MPGQGYQLAAHDDAGGGRVGDVVRDDLEPVLGVGARHLAHHAAAIRGADRVGHVPLLQVGEGLPVGDDVLQRVDVRALDRRIVRIGQHAVGHREPHLRGGVPRGAEAVFAGHVQIGLRARASWRRTGRCVYGSGRHGSTCASQSRQGDQGGNNHSGSGCLDRPMPACHAPGSPHPRAPLRSSWSTAAHPLRSVPTGTGQDTRRKQVCNQADTGLKLPLPHQTQT